jgi:putative transcriptional regulator
VKAKSVWDRVADELNQLAAAVAAGDPLPAGFTTRVVRVSGPPAVDAAGARAARKALGVSQPVFARFLGVSVQTVRAWEQGTRTPAGAVRRLLTDIRHHPDHWAARLREVAVTAKTA